MASSARMMGIPAVVGSSEGEGDGGCCTESCWGGGREDGRYRRTVFWHESDAMHALLVKRADELVGCTEGSPEEEELRALADVIDAYEAKRWASGKMAGGKG